MPLKLLSAKPKLYKDMTLKDKQTNKLPMITAQSLTPGDVLYRSKHLVDHAGVYTGNGEVIHNIPGLNVSVVSLKEFSEGKTVRVTKSNLDPVEFEKQLAQVMNLSSKYSALGFNCEHFMNLLIAKKAHSPQLKAGAVLGAVAGGLALKNKCSLPQTLLITSIAMSLGVAIAKEVRATDGVLAI